MHHSNVYMRIHFMCELGSGIRKVPKTGIPLRRTRLTLFTHHDIIPPLSRLHYVNRAVEYYTRTLEQ